MARKQKTPENILLESWQDARQNRTLASWPIDTYIGYVTGVTNLQNLNVDMSLAQWYELVKKMVAENKI